MGEEKVHIDVVVIGLDEKTEDVGVNPENSHAHTKEQTSDTAKGQDVEDGTDIDAVDRNLNCLTEERLEKVETVGMSTESSHDVLADSSILHQKTEETVSSSNREDQSSATTNDCEGREQDSAVHAYSKEQTSDTAIGENMKDSMDIDAVDGTLDCSIEEELKKVEVVGDELKKVEVVGLRTESSHDLSADSNNLNQKTEDVGVDIENSHDIPEALNSLHQKTSDMVSISKIDQTSAAVTASEGTEPDLAVPSYSKEQIRDAIGGRDVEDCAEIDGVNRNLDCSAEVQVDKVDAVDGSTGNSCSLPADSSSLGQKSEVIVAAEDADMDGKELPSVKQDPQLNLEECLDEDTTCCPAQVNSNSVQKIEIDKQEAEQQEGKVEAINNTADGTLSADSRHSSQSSQEADRGNVKHMKAEIMPTEIGSNLSDKVEKVAAMDNQEVLKPNCGIEESTESDRQENLSDCLDKNADSDFNLAVPSTVEQMEIEKQVTGAEQLSLHGQQDVEIEEELVKAETAYGSIENHGDVCVASESLDQTLVISGTEGTTATAIEGIFPNEASNSSSLDNVQSCSGNDKSMKGEIVYENLEIDAQVRDGGEVCLAEEDKEGKVLESLKQRAEHVLSDVDPSKGQSMKITEEQTVSIEHFMLHEEQGIEVVEHITDTEEPDNSGEEIVKEAALKAESLVNAHQASYQLPRGDEGEFFVSDLVWGKVRSHPWWPGQIFDPADASEKAMKYHKKDCFLVAYFGDRTFAWNEASLLKPFRMHFSQIERQSSSETFQNAVNCALEEVSRREELGLACSCMHDDVYDRIRFQIVENSGIRLESSMRDGLDRLASANSFQPDKLVDYVKALAQSPSGGADQLELVIAKAHLLSFYRLKGYNELPEFQCCGTSVENDVNSPAVEDKMDLDNITEHGTGAYKDHEQNFSGQDTLIFGSSYHRRKHNLKDYHSKKERSLSELMGDALDSPDVEIGPDEKVSNKSISAISGKKRKAIDSVDDESQHEGRKTISLAKVSLIAPNFPKPSFKIGECIRRAASQITGSPSAILKSSSDKFLKAEGSSDGLVVDGYDVSMEASGDALRKGTIMSTDYSSLDELLSQLHLAALDPFRGYNFLNIIVSFFSDFRNSVVVDQPSADKTSGKRKRTSSTNIGSSEAFEFEDMNDTYWTDRVIQNGTEEQQPSEKGGYQIVPVELGKPIQNQNQNQKSRRPYTRKRYSDSNIEPAPEKPPGYIDENAPAELVMNFSEMDALPSETNLNKMFRHFGPIRESDTEVDRETSRARVVFKKCSDAEVAYNSAGKFNIFGPMLVNYQLSYSISEPFKISPVLMSLGEEDTT